jgi:DNA-binding NtrC family response regulator
VFGEADIFGFVGESPRAWRARGDLAFVAQEKAVRVDGAPGTGKDVAVAMLLGLSGRPDASVVRHRPEPTSWDELRPVICGDEGTEPRLGLVAKAGEGTLVLEEVGGLSEESQRELRRVLLGRYTTVVGIDTKVEVKRPPAPCRVIATTTADVGSPEPGFVEGFARADMPSLDDRREDIPLLVRHFVLQRAAADPEVARRFVRTLDGGRKEPRVDPRFVERLLRAVFPRNVRELSERVDEALARSAAGEVVTMPDV